MLASRYRFHGHGSLRFVYAKGQVSRSKFFICKTTNNARRSEPRIAVVVSKKVMKSAVGRNRIRRRLYEAIRAEIPRLNVRSDIVFIVISPELMTASSSEITAAVTSCFKRAGLYKSSEI
ncbi:MAG: ribonuclease P protein component [Patescibacteria group bacterium]